jgi:SmpA / OmlA family
VNAKWFLSATAAILCCSALLPAHCADAAGSSAAGAPIGTISSRQLAKVTPGLSKAQVRSLLGAPWRTVQYNDLDELENEIWEYRGKDSNGSYRIHIEFDRHEVVRIVGKIPDDVSGGKGTPAKS